MNRRAFLLLATFLTLSQFSLSTAAVSNSPYEVAVHEVSIPMPDGVRLSATLFVPMPKRDGEKFPAVLEYLPYRKDEMPTHIRVHSYFARHGFVSARVDIRGTGRSEGHTPDREYSKIEQEDAERVIAWLAHQDWSNGNVGMFGISWGGFNSLQMAMRNPPGLKAIIAICATEDLFLEDVHFIDGMMHADEYELNVDTLNAMTRSPDFPTDEASLAERFDNPPWFVMYKQHPRAGPFWDEPVRPLSSIKIPVFLIGGMLDGYRDSIPRMLQQIKAPVKALLGPWNHSEPDDAVPGPAIEWRDQAVDWWTRWLKEDGKRLLEGPRLAVYMNHWYPPDLQIRAIPGEWRSEESWPPKDSQSKTFYLCGNHELHTTPAEAARHQLAYKPAASQEGGGPDFWWGDVYPDQRSMDAYSLVYDSTPLSKPLSILGRPRACLQASATATSAEWFVRVSDIAPDGTATLVAAAGMNATHRESPRTPKPLDPGREYSLCFDLHLTSWVFPPDHRIRVAVSNSMWPMIWPTPYPMTTTLNLGGAGGSHIDLPVVPDHNSLPIPHFAAPELESNFARSSDASNSTTLNLSSDVPGLSWNVTRDPAHQQASVEWRGGSSDDYPWGREETRELLQFHADDLHPEKTSVHGEAEISVSLKDRALLWRGIMDANSDREFFYVSYKRELLENGKINRTKEWTAKVPRDNQ